MEREHQKIVRFIFCKWCTNKNTDEINEPCADCLDHPANIDSIRPIHFVDDGTLPKELKRREKND